VNNFGFPRLGTVLLVLIIVCGYAQSAISAGTSSPAATLQTSLVYPSDGILTPGQRQIVRVANTVQPSPGTALHAYRLMLKMRKQNGQMVLSNSFHPTQASTVTTLSMRAVASGEYDLTAELHHEGTVIAASQLYRITKRRPSKPSPIITATATPNRTPTATPTTDPSPITTATVKVTATPTATATPIINCSSGFDNSVQGACSAGGASTGSSNGVIWLENATALVGTQLQLLSGTIHNAANAWYKTPLNIQAFTTTFTFQANCSPDPSDCGNGFGFMIVGANYSNPVYPPGYTFSADASDNFSWAKGCPGPPDNNSGCTSDYDSALLKFDLYGFTAPGQNLTNYFQANNSNIGPTFPHSASDISMAPSGINIQSGDIFKVTLTYDGSNLFETITDTSTNASFSHTYTTDSRGNAINLPAIMGANTAFVGFGASNGAATMDLSINSWVYTVNSPGPTPRPIPTTTLGTGARPRA
jgi:hypothetical protein